MIAALLSLTLSLAPEPPAAGYLGLSVRDVPNVGCLVSWIDPGPLDGRGIESPQLARPDLLVTIDGKDASAAALTECLAHAPPGQSIKLRYRRALAHGASFPDAIAHETETRDLEVVAADPVAWQGTFKTATVPATSIAPRPPATILAVDGQGAFATAVRDQNLSEPLDKLLAAQRYISTTQPDARRLSRVSAALEDPLALPDLGRAVAAPSELASRRPVRCAAMLAAANLDATLEPFDGHGIVPSNEPQRAIFALDFLFNEARLKMVDALGDVYANEAFANNAIRAVRNLRTSLLVEGPDAQATLAVIRRGAQIDADALVRAMAHPDAELDLGPLASAEHEELRDELKGAVEGDVLTTEFIPDLGWAVIGGPGANRYDMSKVALVLDAGGDDTYYMSGLALGMRGIIDLAGNDRYEGGENQGIAAGVCGLFLVDDRAGNDTYIGKALNAGCGLFGAGILIDRAGDDTYVGAEWSLGAACWGAGVLLDLGGNDEYRSDYLSQGCGGPRGFGAIVDVNGNDRYDAQGTQPSAYGTPAVCSSFSQGVGVGIRRFSSGGIGLLADLAGNDRYEAGEFAQGGGYFFGLGVLADMSGNDRYWGNRYGQGFAAHQAAGILIDESGDDTYVGMTAATQGAAWDQSVAVLFDGAGSDSYQGDGLAQGSAAQQALAFLIDLDGDDRYIAAGDTAQGHSGTNEYHFAEPAPTGGIWSFSALLDFGAGNDHWSTDRRAGVTMKLGQPNTERPALGTLHGLFLDDGHTSHPTSAKP